MADCAQGRARADRCLVLGINVTPGSFFDGGQRYGVKVAIRHVLEPIEQSADIADVGGGCTRTGAQGIPAEKTEPGRTYHRRAGPCRVPVSVDCGHVQHAAVV